MTNKPTSLPWFFILLDGIGTLFLVIGILGFLGDDFGYPVLQQVAPGFVLIGVLLMVPMIFWVIKKARSR
jgi:hypothetical protein